MSKISYAGGLRFSGKGWTNLDPGYASLNRMKEQSSDTVRGLKENLADIKEQNRKQEINLADVKNTQLQQEERKFDHLNKAEAIGDKARAYNQDVRNQNANTSINNQLAKVKSIGHLSKTISTELAAWQGRSDEREYNAGLQEGMEQGLPLSRQIQQEALEDRLHEDGREIESIADLLQDRGVPSKHVNQIRRTNKARDYGRLKAYSIMAGENWGAFAKAELTKAGITDPTEARQFLANLHIKYLQANKLYGLNADFLGPMHQKMRSGTAAIRTGIDNEYNFQESEDMLNQSRNTFFGLKNGETLTTYLQQYSTSLDAKGNRRGWAATVDHFFEEILTDSSQIDDDKLKELLATPTNNGQTWGDRYKSRVDELWRDRATDLSADARAQKTYNDKISKQKLQVLDQWVENAWNGDLNTLKDAFKELESDPNINKDELGDLKLIYAKQSWQGRENTYWQDELEEMKQNGTLRVSDVKNSNVNWETRKKYMTVAEEMAEVRSKSGMSRKEIEESFNQALRTTSKHGSTITTPHYSVGITTTKAMMMFEKLEQKDGYDSTSAMAEVLARIDKEEGIFSLVDLKNAPSGQNQRYFAHATPGNHANALQTSTGIDVDETLKRVQENEAIFDEELLLPESYYEEQAENLKYGRPVRVDNILNSIAATNPTKYGSGLDLLKRQFKKGNYKGSFSPDFRAKYFKDAGDPTAKRLVEKIRSIEDAAKVHKIIYNNGASDPKYFSQRVRKVVNNTPATPVKLGNGLDVFTDSDGNIGTDPTGQPLIFSDSTAKAVQSAFGKSEGKANPIEMKSTSPNTFLATGNTREYLLNNNGEDDIYYDFNIGSFTHDGG